MSLKRLLPSVLKKYIMAITGFVLLAFLFGHMVGNLQTFEGPEAINKYAHFLQGMKWELLWGFRFTILACIGVHFLMAFLIWIENKKARPVSYKVVNKRDANIFTSTMIFSGIIIIVFFVLHIFQFTVRNLDPIYNKLFWAHHGEAMPDVYAIMITGFSSVAWSVFYIVAMAAIAFHLCHAFSSMFQTMGFRNHVWRGRLNIVAILYALVIFFGFISNPAAVLISKYTPIKIFPVEKIHNAIEQQKDNAKIFVDYQGTDEAFSVNPSKNAQQ